MFHVKHFSFLKGDNKTQHGQAHKKIWETQCGVGGIFWGGGEADNCFIRKFQTVRNHRKYEKPSPAGALAHRRIGGKTKTWQNMPKSIQTIGSDKTKSNFQAY